LRTVALSLALAFALAVGAARPAWAADSIVLVVKRERDPIAVRLRAELEALGFQVVIVPEPAQAPGREVLEATARDAGAVAAVRIVSSKKGVEVWVADRVTGKTVLREVVVPESGSRGTSGTIALRAVELLRASLMEVEGSEPPPGEVPVSPTVRAAAAPRAPRADAAQPKPQQRRTFAAQLGPAVAVANGGLGPTVHTLLDFRWMPSRWLGLDVCGVAPTVPGTLEGPEGKSIVTLGVLGVGAHLSLAPLLGDDARWMPTAGLGLALTWLHLEGVANAPFQGQQDDIFTSAPYLRLGIGYAVFEQLAIVADVIGGVTVPRPVIRFAGREAGAWGPAFGVGSIGAELSWP
jgi:hypothetical protein